jgi:hypothetical protein
MSHTTKLPQTGMTNLEALAAACAAMGMLPPTHERVRLFDGSEHEGTAIRLPGWGYPVCVKADGELVFDNYNGRWGSMETLNEFRQQYTLALTATAMYGHAYTTEALPNGDLRVAFTQ